MSQPYHVLVVDDEMPLAYAFQRYLEKAGFRVTVAYDGATAFALSRQDPPDALVTDFRMPGMDGAELCQKMQQEHSFLPAIIVTGYGSEVPFKNVNAKILQKPVEPAYLLACLRDAIADAQTAAALSRGFPQGPAPRNG